MRSTCLSFFAAAVRSVRACLRPGSVNPAATLSAPAEQEPKNPTVAAGNSAPGREEAGAIRRPLTAAALAERAAATGRLASRQMNRVVYRKAHESLGESVRFPSAAPTKLPKLPVPCVAALLSALLLSPAALPAAGLTEPPLGVYGSIT